MEKGHSRQTISEWGAVWEGEFVTTPKQADLQLGIQNRAQTQRRSGLLGGETKVEELWKQEQHAWGRGGLASRIWAYLGLLDSGTLAADVL